MLYPTVRYLLEQLGSVDHLKLQKLVYMSFGFYAGKNEGKYLFPNAIQAWQYGPVIPDLYEIIRENFGDAAVSSHACFDDTDALDRDHREAIDLVLKTYGKDSGWMLTEYTHRKDTLWFRHYREGVRDVEIPRDEIADYYQKAFQLAAEYNKYKDVFVALSKQ